MDKHYFIIEYHLVDSCNLNCAGCSHYSPLVQKEEFKTVEEIIRDLDLLKSKTGDKLDLLRLLGGEPLLHPQISTCLKSIRNIFPKTHISLVTNGLLLRKMDNDFYNVCREQKIRIMITDYKIIDVQAIISNLTKQGIFADVYKTSDMWDYQRIRLTKDKIDSLPNCSFKDKCNSYRNGKIYLCPQIAYIDYFNKYFNKNIKFWIEQTISL